MLDYESIYKSFPSEVNRLGLEAVKLKGTDDFQPVFRKLLSYFKDNYCYYLLGQLGILRYYIETGEIRDDKLEDYVDFYQCVVDGIDTTLLNIINSFDENKVAETALRPFSAYLWKTLEISHKKEKKQRNDFNNSSSIIPEKKLIELNRLLKLLDSNDEIYNLSGKKGDAICKKLGITRKHLDILVNAYAVKNAAHLEEPVGEEGESELGDFIPDEDANIDETVEDKETIAERGYNPFVSEEKIEYVLKKLNTIYRESFFEKHQIVFPKGFTNDYIVLTVKGFNKPPENFATTVKRVWDELEIDYKRNTYANGDYLCMDAYMFDWFERVKRQILSKEIAELLNLKAPNYTKIYNQAISIVRDKITL